MVKTKTVEDQSNENVPNLYDRLETLPDFRRAEGKRHELRLALIIVIMAIMSGYGGLRPIEDFIKKNRKELLKLFRPNKDRLPSRSTITRILENVDFNDLNKIVTDWFGTQVGTKLAVNEWLAADGKAIGGTVTDAKNSYQEFTGLVTLFRAKTKEVVAVDRTNSKKENEIPKLQELIKTLGLEGLVISADALHCQTKTAKTIIESKNNYCLGVKGNQPKLLASLKKKYNRKPAGINSSDSGEKPR